MVRWEGGELGLWNRRERVRDETRNDSGLPSTPLTVYIIYTVYRTGGCYSEDQDLQSYWRSGH